MEVALRGGLGQDTAEGVVRGVGFDGEGEIWLEVLEEGSGCESKLQPAERITFLLCPFQAALRVRSVRGEVRVE